MSDTLTPTYDALDDFAGPGGWDEGAKMIGLRLLGVEINEAACRTAVAAGHTRICADVETVPSGPFRGIPGYIASPPCTDFSTAGKQHGEHGKSGRLVRVPLGRALELMPEWIVWEQVTPVLPIWEECAAVLRPAGYGVWTGVLDAARYGVCQHRRRAVLIASRVRRVMTPTATHGGPTGGLFDLTPMVTLADILNLGSGWSYDSGQNTVRGDGSIERYTRSCDRPAGTITSKAAGQWVLTRGTISRKISLSDAAVIQGFRSDYPWHGTAGQQAKQIGDAVPPLLAAHILAAVTGRQDQLAARLAIRGDA